jgi:ubiquinone biosynthesis O-methyltransferase
LSDFRIPFIRNGLTNAGTISSSVSNSCMSLKGLRVLDVGCGGGILSEPLARIGASVEGLDASEEAVRAAEEHAALDPSLRERLTYRHGTLEEVAAEGRLYDVVLMSEVLEHMNSPQHCVSLASQILKVAKLVQSPARYLMC